MQLLDVNALKPLPERMQSGLHRLMLALRDWLPTGAKNKALGAEIARLKRLYLLALNERDAIASGDPEGWSQNDLQTYIEDRVRARTEKLRTCNAQLLHLAHTDLLTGLPNRRAFLNAAHAEQARLQRNGRGACVILADIDYFKAFNDRCGHAAGDRVLQTVASVLRAQTRAADTVARWGGEELILLLPETPLTAAECVAEKCRSAIEACALRCGESHLYLTMTFGVSNLLPGEALEAAIARADSALYLGKSLGRNQVAVAPEQGECRCGGVASAELG